jgi:hypothetical protein
MKYWDITKRPYGDEITLKDVHNSSSCPDYIIEIKKLRDGKVRFQEKCDSYFSEEYTKQEAILLLKEAIAFLEEDYE